MLYALVEMSRAGLTPLRMGNRMLRAGLNFPGNPIADTELGRSMSAWSALVESMTRYYGKPEWRIEDTQVNGKTVPVTPTRVWSTPWAGLVRFEKDKDALAKARGGDTRPESRLLIVAPLSGHYATLLRGTVEAFLPTHDVYITDWADARMVPLFEGRFDLDDYIGHIQMMLRELGGGAHVVAVCQPGPPVLAAISLMAEDKDPALPASMTFMGSPIDARRSPTIPNKLAEERPFSWFEDNMIYTVPAPYPGTLRRVYPGFVQLASFMHMNWDRHVDAQWNFFSHLVDGDGDGAEKHRAFYDEYLSVLDMTAEFYLQTIKRVFQEHHLPRGIFRHKGRLVRPSAVTSVGLMTVEGENDDISGIGQTQAAHDICVNIPASMKDDYVQPGVGHYGVFNGSRFQSEIVPRVNAFIARHSRPESDEAAEEKGKSAPRRPQLRLVGLAG